MDALYFWLPSQIILSTQVTTQSVVILLALPKIKFFVCHECLDMEKHLFFYHFRLLFPFADFHAVKPCPNIRLTGIAKNTWYDIRTEKFQ